jgi:2,4-dichlorophenol 6-monooxygenase
MAGLDLGVCYTGAGVIEDGAPPVSENPVSIYVPSTTPGTRLPHAPLKRDGTRISTLDLVPYDRFLIWTQHEDDALDAALAQAAARGVPVSLQHLTAEAGIIPADDAFAALFPADEVLVIRPDGHIAARLPADQAAADIAGALAQLWSAGG